MAPPNGTAVDVPDGRAIFAPGAQSTSVNVIQNTNIENIEFTPGTEAYKIHLPKYLKLIGNGIINNSEKIQEFYAESKNGGIYFWKKSIAGMVAPGTKNIRIYNRHFGETHFDDRSNAASSKIINRKKGALILGIIPLIFGGRSSAGSSELINSGRKSEIHFYAWSDGNKATIRNMKGSIYFDWSYKKPFSIRRIANSRNMIVGRTKVRVSDTLTLKRKSKLNIELAADKGNGKLIVINEATIDGQLFVTGHRKLETGQYVLISSHRKISGKFRKATFTGFKPAQKQSLIYTPKEVILKVRK